jgi:hypothetical protein
MELCVSVCVCVYRACVRVFVCGGLTGCWLRDATGLAAEVCALALTSARVNVCKGAISTDGLCQT